MSALLAVTVAERLTAAGVGLGCLGVGIALAVRRRRDDLQPFDPVVAFLLAWGFALAVFALPFIRFITSSTQAWIAVYGSILAFCLGAWVVSRRLPERQAPSSQEALSPGRIRVLWALTLLLGLIGFAMFVRAVDDVLGWRALFEDLTTVRVIQTTSQQFDDVYGPWRLLTYFLQIAFLLWTIGLRAGAFRGRWLFLAPVGLLAVVPFLFTGERTLLGTMLIWTMFFHLVWRPVRSFRRLGLVALGAVVVLASAFAFIGGRVDKTLEFHPEIEAAIEADVVRGQALEYVYVAANIPALSQLMDDPIAPRTYGQMTLLPMVKLTHAVTGIGGEPPEEVGAFYPVPFETFNNYSWLGSFYLDFGLAGCLVLPFLWGAVAAACSRLVQRRVTVLGAWTLSLVLYVIAFTPLLNKLSTTLTWQYLLVGPLIVPLLAPGGRYRLPEWLRIGRLRRRALGAAIAAGLLVLVTTAAATDNPAPPTTSAELDERLRVAAERASRAIREGRVPAPPALASRLHVADPGLRYEPRFDFRIFPTSRDAISVFTRGPDDLWLWGRLGDGVIRGAHVIMRGPERGIHIVPERSPNLLANGDLENPVVEPWQVSSSRVATVQTFSQLSFASNDSLLVRGTGKRARVRGGTFVTQIVDELPNRGRDAVYTLRLNAFTRRLSRALPAAMAFRYSDGSVEFFQAYGGSSGVKGPYNGPPIVGTTEQFWRVATAVGRARKPLRSVQVYLFDTGPQPLRGRLWLDAVSLTAGTGIAAFPKPR